MSRRHTVMGLYAPPPRPRKRAAALLAVTLSLPFAALSVAEWFLF